MGGEIERLDREREAGRDDGEKFNIDEKGATDKQKEERERDIEKRGKERRVRSYVT